MFSNTKLAQAKDNRRDSEQFHQFTDKIASSKERKIRRLENNFPNKYIDHKEYESKDKEEKFNSLKRNAKKSLFDTDYINFQEKLDITNSADKINKNCLKEISINKFDVEEYQGLSYLNQKSSPIRSDDTSVTDNDNDLQKLKKKSVEVDFRMKYKTEICKFWELNKECRYGNNCAFAHGVEDIRSKVNQSTNYKTKKCKQFYDTGYCPYGSRCQFLHNELRKLSTPRPHNLFNIDNLSHRKFLEYFVTRFLFSKVEEKENIIKSRPRLKTFTLITNKYTDIHNIHKWSSSAYLTEVDGLNKNEGDIISNNSNDNLVNLTIDSFNSAPRDLLDQ